MLHRCHVRFANIIVGIAIRSGWAGRGSNPGADETFCTRPDRLRSQPSLQYSG
jgi:hypothetical protein